MTTLFLSLFIVACNGDSNRVSVADPSSVQRLYIQQQTKLPLSELPAGVTVEYKAFVVYGDNSIKDITDDAVWSSSDEEVIAFPLRSQSAVAKLLQPGQAEISAFYADINSAPIEQIVTSAELIQVNIYGDNEGQALGVGNTAAFKAIGEYTNGDVSLEQNDGLVWQSSMVDVVSIAPTGSVSAIQVGESNISARMPQENIDSDIVEVAVVEDRLLSISIVDSLALERSNVDLSLPVGLSHQYQAMGYFDSGNSRLLEEADQLAWHSSNDAALTITTEGMVQGVELGFSDITVSMGGSDAESNSVKVEITDAALELITIHTEPNINTLPIGLTIKYKATGTYSDGKDREFQSGDGLVWESDDSDKAEIDSLTGVLKAKSIGDANITVEKGAVESLTSPITVIEAELLSLSIEPKFVGGDITVVGSTTEFKAIGTYTSGDIEINSDDIYWDSGACTNQPVNKGVVNVTEESLDNICSVIGQYDGKLAIAHYSAIATNTELQFQGSSKKVLGWRVAVTDDRQYVVGYYGACPYNICQGTRLTYSDIRGYWGEDISQDNENPIVTTDESFKVSLLARDNLAKVHDVFGNFDLVLSGSEATGVWSRTEAGEGSHYIEPQGLARDDTESTIVFVKLELNK